MAHFTFSTGLTLRSKRGSDSRAAWAIIHNGKSIASGTALTREDAVKRVAAKLSRVYAPSLPELPYKPAKAVHAPWMQVRAAIDAGWKGEDATQETAHAFLLRRWREAMAARRAAVVIEIVDAQV